jgi:hypothetical protein
MFECAIVIIRNSLLFVLSGRKLRPSNQGRSIEGSDMRCDLVTYISHSIRFT